MPRQQERPALHKILREPLVHFLLVGALIFAGYNLIDGPEDVGSPRIEVNKPGLERFVQLRSRVFDAQATSKRLEAMTTEEAAALVESYVQEEALYREALALGLDRDDYVIKQRMIQSLKFLARNAAPERNGLTEEDLRQFYEAHRGRYHRPALISFDHIYFNAERHGWRNAELLAFSARKSLDLQSSIPDQGKLLESDPYPYGSSYAGRDRRAIVADFGEAMANALFSLPASSPNWIGPLRSNLGYHLVHVQDKRPADVMIFEEARRFVQFDAEAATAAQRERAFIAAVLKKYRADLSVDVRHARGKK